MKLSKRQEDILARVRCGAKIHFMSGLNAYWFINDSMENCTKTVWALERAGKLKFVYEDVGDHKMLKEALVVDEV